MNPNTGIDAVTVMNDVFVWFITRDAFSELLERPLGRRMVRHVDGHDSAASHFHNDQHVSENPADAVLHPTSNCSLPFLQRASRHSKNLETWATVKRMAIAGPPWLVLPFDVKCHLFAQKEILGGERILGSEHESEKC